MRGTSGVTKYEIIRNDLAEQIDNGKYIEKDKLPSENELVEIYGVSRVTVSKALAMLVNDGYIYRKQGKGSYVTPYTMRKSKQYSLLNKKSNIKKVGLIIPHLSDSHSLSIANAIGHKLQYPLYDFSIVQSYTEEYEKYTIQKLRSEGYSGLIIFPIDLEIYSETILAMQLEHFPYILIDRNFPGINSSYVITDNIYGGILATKHLIALKHTKIAFCAIKDASEQVTFCRYNGFINEMHNNKIPISEKNTYFELCEKSLENLGDMIKSRQITAAIACNVHSARLILELCYKNNINIPSDFSLICFDRPSVIKHQYEFLTYIDQHSESIGEKAAESIAELINEPKGSPVQKIITPSLVVNCSTAPL